MSQSDQITITYLDIFKEYMLCTAKHCTLRSRKLKLYGDITDT